MIGFLFALFSISPVADLWSGQPVLIGPSAADPRVAPRMIYGPDNRKDYYEITDPDLRRLAESTPAIFRRAKLSFSGDRVRLNAKPYGETKKLCSDERFFSQPTGSYCSSALVGPDLILTAGHCALSRKDCSELAVVFDYRLSAPGDMVDSFPPENVYACKSILVRKYYLEGVDYALIRLDRPVQGREPLPLNFSSPLEKSADLVLFGYPTGLPLKIADQAHVREIHAGYFDTDTDSFAGNSGSPILNARTKEIEGVLVRGDADHVLDPKRGCYVEKRCVQGGCRGENATLAAELKKHMKAALEGAPQAVLEQAQASADPNDGSGRMDLLLRIPSRYQGEPVELLTYGYSRSAGKLELIQNQAITGVLWDDQTALTIHFMMSDPEDLSWGGARGKIELKIGSEIVDSEAVYIRAM